MERLFTKLMLTLSVGVVFCAVPCGAQGEATPLKQLFTLEKFGLIIQLFPAVERGEDLWFCALTPNGYNKVWRFRDSTDTIRYSIQCLNPDSTIKSGRNLNAEDGQVVYGDFNGDGLRDWLSGDWTLFEGRPSGVLQCVDSVRRGASFVMDLDKDGYDDVFYLHPATVYWGHPTRPLQARSSIAVERFDTVFFGGDYKVNAPEIIFPTRVRDTAIVMYTVWYQNFYDEFYDQRWQYVQTLNEDDIRSHAPTIRTAGPRNAVRRISVWKDDGFFYPSLSYYRHDRYVIVSGDTIYELTPTSLIPQRSEQIRIDPPASRVTRYSNGWSPIDTLRTTDGFYFFTFGYAQLQRLQVDLFEITASSDPFPQRTGHFVLDPPLPTNGVGGYTTRASFFRDQTGDGKYEIAIAYKPDSCRGEFDPECWTTRIFDVFGSRQPTAVTDDRNTEATDVTMSRCVLRWSDATAEPLTVRTVDTLGKLLGVVPATADVLRNGLPLPPSMCPRGMVHVQIVWDGGMKTATFMNDDV